MKSTLEQVYQDHHHGKHRGGFAILERDRGGLFKKLIGRDKKVLDLGCRDGVLTKYFIEGNTVTGADIDSDALGDAEKKLGIQILHFDVQADSWPIQTGQFDVIVAGELIEHIYFPEKFIQKVSRSLNPGSVFIGSVPHAFALKNKLKYLFNIKKGTPLDDPMHINHFAWREFSRMLNRHFSKVELYPLGRNWGGLKPLFPSLLAYSIAFKATK